VPIRLRLALAWALVATVMVAGGALLFHNDVQDGLTDAALAHVRRNLIAGAVLIVLVGSVGSWLLARAALRPVERMRRQAIADVAQLELPGTHDELNALAVTLNELLDRLHASLAQQRQLVADASHELRTPLAVLRTELELAQRPGRSREELLEALANAAEETDRLSRLAEDLLAVGQHSEGLPLGAEVQPLAPLLHASVDAGRERSTSGVGFSVDVPADLTAPVDGGRLRQAVDNLIDNAARVAPAGTTVHVSGQRDDNGSVVIAVVDSGPGFPAEFLPYAFDRFRRADAARTKQEGGTGLGLAIVKAIAEAHGGTAEVRNRAEGGADVRLILPAR
jgi:two-component system OmpR family sensor kinase